ncbi:MAG: phospholipase D-like domain-containing protein, partial [Bacteroidota bacterium]|nr:phospholipase D-like domain-containing protein [Bacteroidota bacterium]
MDTCLFVIWSQLWEHTSSVVNVLYIITIIFTVALIILENRTPLKTIAWILVLILLPFAGIVIYLFFGQSYRKQKIFSRKGFKALDYQRRLAAVQLKRLHEFSFYTNMDIHEKVPLIRLLLNNSLSLVSDDNEVEVFHNGKDTFNSILTELRKATHHIHLEYYIIVDDQIGREIRDILIEKARSGVKVRLIYDDVGSWDLPKNYVSSLEEAGVDVYCFMRVRFPWLTSKVNFRNHRKIIVIDGKVGFTGGLNIADRYIVGLPEIG